MLLRMLLLSVLVLSAGCSGPEGLGDDAPHGDQGRFGLVSVSYDHDWSHGEEATPLTTSAQFVRYSALDRDQVARLLALPLDPGRDLPSLDRCKTYSLSADAAAEVALEGDETGSVELVEAGDLRIRTDDKSVTLSPRHFPWLLPFISGVVYGEAQSSTVKKVGLVTVSADGGEAVGAFAVQTSSPALPRIIKVGGVQPSALVTVRQGPLALTWAGAGAAGQDAVVETDASADVTYAELRFQRDKRDMVLRCRVQDDGSFDLPLAGVAAGRVTLDLVRLRTTQFSASGLDQGELRVAARDRVSLALE